MASPPYEQEYMCDFIHGISQDNNTEPLQKAISFYAVYAEIIQTIQPGELICISASLKLIESGEKERLKELLRERLVECGWKDEMKAICRTYTKKKGRDKITIDDLINAITPDGRAKVPDSVKKELLQQIESFLSSAL